MDIRYEAFQKKYFRKLKIIVNSHLLIETDFGGNSKSHLKLLQLFIFEKGNFSFHKIQSKKIFKYSQEPLGNSLSLYPKYAIETFLKKYLKFPKTYLKVPIEKHPFSKKNFPTVHFRIPKNERTFSSIFSFSNIFN